MNDYLDKLITADATKALNASIRSDANYLFLNLTITEVKDWLETLQSVQPSHKLSTAINEKWGELSKLLFNAYIEEYKKTFAEELFAKVKTLEAQQAQSEVRASEEEQVEPLPKL